MPVSRLKQVLTSQDVSLLLAADRHGLLPDPQFQTAVICSVLANIHRGKDTKPHHPEDFLLKERKATRQTAEQMLAQFHRRRHGGNW